MEIIKGLETVDTSLFLKAERLLVINDLHLGYEEAMHAKGVLVPKFQLEEIIARMRNIFNMIENQNIKINKIVINGDLKHEFGKVLRQEWNDVLKFIDFCLLHCNEVVIVQGNHDSIIKPIAEKREVKVVSELRIGKKGEIIIIHGDEIADTEAKTIIIGHEHPAITIREGSKYEKFKCFLVGKFKKQKVIVVPSFNPLLEGTDVLDGQMLSPYLGNIDDFTVYVIGEKETYDFGKVKKIKKMN